ncbi:MAG TPA: hypothetical protein VHD84_01835 [Candidatus Saccharimonadales bacterium]|nr:hypothetical protein [Candidatus Saccharimonadales bacterium]
MPKIETGPNMMSEHEAEMVLAAEMAAEQQLGRQLTPEEREELREAVLSDERLENAA